MNDDEARALGWKLGAIQVVEFAQLKDHCIAYTATWIRRRFKGRDLFDEKKQMGKFDSGIPNQPRFAWTKQKDPSGGFMPNKFEVKQDTFEDNNAMRSAEYEKNRKAGRDQPTTMSMESQYIIGGRSFSGLSNGAPSNRVMQMLPPVPKAFIEGADTFRGIFRLIFDTKCFGSIGFSAKPAHAVALDCTRVPLCVYFDPNLGELTFPKFELFWDWWERCFNDRADGDGAWGKINVDGQVEAMRYAP